MIVLYLHFFKIAFTELGWQAAFIGELQVTSMAVTAWTNLHAEGGDYDEDDDDDGGGGGDDGDDVDDEDDGDDIDIKNGYRPHW